MSNEIRYQINPLFKIDLKPSNTEENEVVIELLLEGKSYCLPQGFLFDLVSFFEKSLFEETEVTEFLQKNLSYNEEQATTLLKEMQEKRIIVLENYKEIDLKAVEHWVERGWLDALIFHLSTKSLIFTDDNQKDESEYLRQTAADKIKREGLPGVYTKKSSIIKIKLNENLPLPNDRSFEEILLARRTHKPWSKEEFSIDELSSILFYSSIETKRLREETLKNINSKPETIFNSSFSALDIYLFVYDINGLEPGIYFYDIEEHSLALLKKGLLREEVSKMCIGQERAGSGKVTFLVSATWSKYMFRYRHPRAYRNLLINISELAQKLLVLSTAFKKTTFLTPAFNDELADELLEVNGYEEAPLYAVTAG